MCRKEQARRGVGFEWRAFGLAASLLALAACRQSPVSDAGRSPTRDAVTFNKDVAPILLEHCATCHRPANPNAGKSPEDQWCFAGAPFSLIEYRDVREHAKQIADATARRIMPPWLPERGAGTFANARGLRDDQIAILQRWADQGAVEGDAGRQAAAAEVARRLAARPARSRAADAGGLSAAGHRQGRLPQLRRAGAADRRPATCARIEFRAGNPRSLHHASVGVDRLRVSRKVDRADREPGFAAMPDDQVENVYGWTPGKAPFMEPADRAWTLERGSDLVMQLHMLPTGAPEVIQPSIGLFFRDRPPAHAPLPIKLESKSIDIPAGQADYAIDDRYVLPADVDVLSVYPHAHYLAQGDEGDGDASRRHRQAAHLDPLVGFPLAGSVPLRRAAVSAEGHDDRDAFHLRQLGRATRTIPIIRRSA